MGNVDRYDDVFARPERFEAAGFGMTGQLGDGRTEPGEIGGDAQLHGCSLEAAVSLSSLRSANCAMRRQRGARAGKPAFLAGQMAYASRCDT
jgi:hypothetical protein